MAKFDASPAELSDERQSDECGRDAAALVKNLGVQGVDWLDGFLADYLFAGEPLDLVMVRARALAGLSHRPRRAAVDL